MPDFGLSDISREIRWRQAGFFGKLKIKLFEILTIFFILLVVIAFMFVCIYGWIFVVEFIVK